MTNFTVLTDEQAAHDAATSKRYIEALREVQAENARLREAILDAVEKLKASEPALNGDGWTLAPIRDEMLAALGETK